MRKIGNIHVAHMSNGAHFTFVGNILARAEADKAVMAKAGDLVKNFRTAIDAEDEAMNISRKSMLTDGIADANRERDAIYIAYKRAVQSLRKSSTESIAEAARVLSQHIRDYRINIYAQLDKKTGLLMNFIDDLEEKYKEQVEELSLTPFVSKLKNANERVRTLTLQRTDERTTIIVGALRKARRATDTAYRGLVEMVNSLAVVFGDKDYSDFMDYVNTEIAHYKREVLGQKSPSPATEEEEENSEDSPTENSTQEKAPESDGNYGA